MMSKSVSRLQTEGGVMVACSKPTGWPSQKSGLQMTTACSKWNGDGHSTSSTVIGHMYYFEGTNVKKA